MSAIVEKKAPAGETRLWQDGADEIARDQRREGRRGPPARDIQFASLMASEMAAERSSALMRGNPSANFRWQRSRAFCFFLSLSPRGSSLIGIVPSCKNPSNQKGGGKPSAGPG
jgi:hypothetical protein